MRSLICGIVKSSPLRSHKASALVTVISLIICSFLLLFPEGSWAKDERMVEVIIDASSSMNQKLKSGEVKLHAVRKAVDNILMRLDGNTVISFRTFGSQSPKEKRDCLDTRVLTGFGQLIGSVGKTMLQMSSLRAQGYAPVSFALSEAIKDFPPEFKGEMVIVLVSDGRDTCQGDPCTTAQNMTKDRTKLVIHTVGFGVDDVSKVQLECIAKSSGGRYFGAEDSSQLAKAIQAAVETPRSMIVRKIGEGRLTVEGNDPAGYSVISSETGDKLSIIYQGSAVKLPAGIYSVSIGKGYWRSVEVSPGETTVLKPAVIKIEHPSIAGHKVIDKETGEEMGQISQTKDILTLVPGEYDVLFGKVLWHVTAGPGAKVILKPGLVTLKGAGPQGSAIRRTSGELVETLSNTFSTAPLPPGDYTIDIDGKQKPFSLKESEVLTFQRK